MLQNKIFDICGTLYDSNTTMDFCEYRAFGIQKKILKFSKSFFGKVINKILLKSFDYDWTRILHITTLKNIEQKVLDQDAEKFVEDILENKKIIEVHKYLQSFDKNRIILVSATIEPVAKAIAENLGGLKYLSTTLEYKDGKCLGKIKDDLLGNKQKYFIDKEIYFVITDNKSDLALCQMAKEVVIVSKKKNISFWENQEIKISKIIEV